MELKMNINFEEIENFCKMNDFVIIPDASCDLTKDLRDRFGIVHRLELYDIDSLSVIVKRSAGILEMEIDDIRKLCMMIESHLGNTKNNKIDLPTPVNEIQRYVYRCNYLASRKYINIKFNKLDIID